MLITSGANVNHKNKKGETPLMIAVRKGQVEIVETLLINNADLSVKDEEGRTAFDYAIIFPNYKIREILKKRNKDIEII